MNAFTDGWHPLVQVVGWTLVHFLWQAALVGVAFVAARAPLSRSNCRGRYALGVVALAALAMLPIATFAFLCTHLDGGDVATVTASVADAETSLASVQAHENAGADSLLVSLMPWLVGGWCVGVVVMLLRAGRQWLRLARIAQRFADSMPELDAVFGALRLRFGVASRVAVRVSHLIDTPMLIGWIKPIVLLPTAVAIGFPRAELELVLAHELGHLRRFDHLVNLAQTVLETILFYHPVVHWVSREVRDQRELCCDQLVVKVMSADARRYARALASLEEARYSSRLALAASGGELVERVRRLVGIPSDLGFERRSSSSRLGPIALVALTIVAGAAILRRVDVPTLMLRPLALEWPAPVSLKLSPLFAGLALMPQRPRLAPIEMPPSPAKLPPRQLTPAVASSAAHPSTGTAAVAASVVEPGPRGSSQPVMAAPTAPPAASTAAPMAPASPTAALSRSPLPSVPVEQPRSNPAPAKARLVPIHTALPQFPAWSRSENGRVDVSFSIGADGSVRDVEASGNTPPAFEIAAKAALRQWRFDPATVADHAERFTQSFVFELTRRGSGSTDNCVRVTGSMICRSPADAEAQVRTIRQPHG